MRSREEIVDAREDVILVLVSPHVSFFVARRHSFSLSEAKGTQTRFLGRLKVAAFADVIRARIQSESEYKWKKISRFQNRNSFSLSLSLRKEKGTQKLSLSFPSLFLFTFEVFSLSSKEGAF